MAAWALALAAAPAPTAAAQDGEAGPAPCNYYYEWIGRTRFPLQADPHATYSYVAPSSRAAQDGIGFLVRGEFIHGVWTSWLTYDSQAKPFSGVNFVDNPPASTYNPARPDPRSISPFDQGRRMLGTPRDFTLLFRPADYGGAVAPVLDGTPTAEIDAEGNVRPYPPAAGGAAWVLANRNYQAFPGYNPGGTKDTFTLVTAVRLATGEAVDCQTYNALPERVQRPPTDPPQELDYRLRRPAPPVEGSPFPSVAGLGGKARLEFAPRNPRGLVQFTRPPLAAGADVAEVPPPQDCAGYLGARTSTRLISLVRIPRVANFTDTRRLRPSTRYPNRADRRRPWDASFTSFSIYGASSGFYLPGKPRTSSLAGHELKPDRSGGATIVIWPRHYSPGRARHVFRYARGNDWAIVRGGTAGPETTANVLVRLKGSRSDYEGRFSNLPCYFDRVEPNGRRWMDVPVQRGSEWVAGPGNLGAAAPQGVTCRSVRDLVSGRCARRLKAHVARTGGRYSVPLP